MAKIVECQLCPRHCRLKEGERGDCRVRVHLDGQLKTLVYGNPCSINVDPIEKKPLYHVLPGSMSFSLATAGCNLHCRYCQNWEISQRNPEELKNYNLAPDEIVNAALKSKCRSIAYTYNDPVIFYEYAYDISQIARKNNLLNVLVTAGYIEQEPLIELCQYTDAAHIDLKGITEEFYRDMCFATLKPVLDAIKTMKKQGVWIELINLIVPTWNDKDTNIKNLCLWVLDNVGPDVPVHFSKFWPTHQLKNLPPTPTETLTNAWQIAKSLGINYPYVGNVPGHEGNNTYCPQCGNLIIKRGGYSIIENNLTDGICNFCGKKIPGIWR